jgi:phosphatidate cytidylyltransferase
MLAQRLATAAIGIPLIMAAVWVGGALLAGVVAVAVFVAVIEIEFARVGATSSPPTSRATETGIEGLRDRVAASKPAATIPETLRQPATLVAAGAAAALPPSALAGYDWLLAAVALAVLASTAAVIIARTPAEGIDAWHWGVATSLYFGYLAGHFVLLRELPDGREWLLLVLLTVWAADTGAYAVGRAVGRHKLAPAISPGKTVEGAAGSSVTGFVAVALLNEAFALDLAIEHVVALGLLLPAAALVGDLAESALKRSLGVKDSSGLVPGHGGVADRLDSLLFAAPVAYWYATAFVS